MLDDFVRSNSTISRDSFVCEQRYSHLFDSKYWSFPCYLYKFRPFCKELVTAQNFNFALMHFSKKFPSYLLQSDVSKSRLDCNTEEGCRQLIRRVISLERNIRVYFFLMFFIPILNPYSRSCWASCLPSSLVMVSKYIQAHSKSLVPNINPFCWFHFFCLCLFVLWDVLKSISR